MMILKEVTINGFSFELNFHSHFGDGISFQPVDATQADYNKLGEAVVTASDLYKTFCYPFSTLLLIACFGKNYNSLRSYLINLCSDEMIELGRNSSHPLLTEQDKVDISNVCAAWDEYKYNCSASETAKKNNSPQRRASGYVYLVQSPSKAYKIGRTNNPENRLKTFSVKLPFEVEFIALIQTPDMKALEAELHQRFADKRVNGKWFELDNDDVEYIKGLA